MKKLITIIALALIALVGCRTEEDPCNCQAVFSEYDLTDEVWTPTDTTAATHCEESTVIISDTRKMDIVCK